jgi:hypothetical protein
MYSGSFKYSDGMSGAQHLVGNRRIDKTATAEYDDFVHLRGVRVCSGFSAGGKNRLIFCQFLRF